MLKKIIAFLPLSLLFVSFFGLLALPAWAAPTSGAGNDVIQYLNATAIKGGLTTPEKAAKDDAVMILIGGIINVVLSLTGIIFFVQTFYHGFRWMTAGGNDTIITESKSGLKQSIIGIVIVFSAFIISNFVINSIQSITNPDQATSGGQNTTQPAGQ